MSCGIGNAVTVHMYVDVHAYAIYEHQNSVICLQERLSAYRQRISNNKPEGERCAPFFLPEANRYSNPEYCLYSNQLIDAPHRCGVIPDVPISSIEAGAKLTPFMGHCGRDWHAACELFKSNGCATPDCSPRTSAFSSAFTLVSSSNNRKPARTTSLAELYRPD